MTLKFGQDGSTVVNDRGLTKETKQEMAGTSNPSAPGHQHKVSQVPANASSKDLMREGFKRSAKGSKTTKLRQHKPT